MAKKAHMSTKATERLVREGDFVAEVDVHLIEADSGWAPYLAALGPLPRARGRGSLAT
jgi:hypothetical protein